MHVIGLLVFATVFRSADDFNGDLNKWDVAKVLYMDDSKSIRIVQIALTCREVSCLCVIGGFGRVGGFGVWWW